MPAKTIKGLNKAGTTTLEHCVISGVMAQCLFDNMPERVKTLFVDRFLVGLVVAGHDVGKISPQFLMKFFRNNFVTQYLPSLLSQKIDTTQDHHTLIGESCHKSLTKGKSLQSLSSLAHHGYQNADTEYVFKEGCLRYGGLRFARWRRCLLFALERFFRKAYVSLPVLNAFEDSIQKIFCGITTVSDWLASDENNFPPDKTVILDSSLYTTCKRILKSSGFIHEDVKQNLSFSDIFNFSPNDQQKSFYEKISKPGMYIMEAPMGGGKTEAALYATYKLIEKGYHHGFYFALPTRLTSNKIHERVSAFMKKISPRKGDGAKLAHGMAWLQEWESGKNGICRTDNGISEWFKPNKRALLHPYTVGTIDQLLLSVVNAKHNFVRSFGIVGKVIILDEVHSYDVYTSSIIDKLIEDLLSLKCTVIILSATLTGERRNSLLKEKPSDNKDSYPLFSFKPEDENAFYFSSPIKEKKEILIKIRHWGKQKIAEDAIKKMNEGACVLIIANTVAMAQEYYAEIKPMLRQGEDDRVGLLHSRFTFQDREIIESSWMSKLGKAEKDKDGNCLRPEGCILISTQIVEQSVDIDADYILSEIAPIDMLLQRMGRLWRHNRKNRIPSILFPEMVILSGDPFCSDNEKDVKALLGNKTCRVYSPYVLMKTYQVLSSRQSIFIPQDIRGIIEETYSHKYRNSPVQDIFEEEMLDVKEKMKDLAVISTSNSVAVKETEASMDEPSFFTRHSDVPTEQVLLVRNIKKLGFNHYRLTFEKEENGARIPLEIELTDKDKLDYSIAHLLNMNMLSVPRYLITKKDKPQKDEVDPWLKNYFHKKPVILNRSNSRNNQLEWYDGDEDCINLSYSFDMGMKQIKNQNT